MLNYGLQIINKQIFIHSLSTRGIGIICVKNKKVISQKFPPATAAAAAAAETFQTNLSLLIYEGRYCGRL